MTNKISNQTPEWQLNNELIHLNHAAVGPWPSRTQQAICEFASENATQGSWNYLKWIEVEKQLREQLREIINAESVDEISLLKNTSEALSVIAYGLPWSKGDNVVISNEEFPSNYIVWESLQSQGVEIRYADLTANAENALIELCDGNTRLLSISSVQYASGRQINLNTLGDYCSNNKVLFCVDAIQSIGAHELDVMECKADFVVADGHKWMLGPEGVALFYCREAVRDLIQLKQFGWHMVEDFLNFDAPSWEIANSSRRFECGSPNMLGIHGLHASLSLLLELGMPFVAQQIQEKVEHLMLRLDELPNIEIVSPRDIKQRSGIITFKSKVIDQASLFKQLTDNKVFCAMRGGGIRFSPHYYTATEQIDKAVKVISEM